MHFFNFKAIKSIKEIWSSVCINFEPYKDKGIYYVKVNDDIFQLLEDHLVQLSIIKTSKYKINIYTLQSNVYN